MSRTLGILNITFPYLLEIIFPIVGWCETLWEIETTPCLIYWCFSRREWMGCWGNWTIISNSTSMRKEAGKISEGNVKEIVSVIFRISLVTPVMEWVIPSFPIWLLHRSKSIQDLSMTFLSTRSRWPTWSRGSSWPRPRPIPTPPTTGTTLWRMRPWENRAPVTRPGKRTVGHGKWTISRWSSYEKSWSSLVFPAGDGKSPSWVEHSTN